MDVCIGQSMHIMAHSALLQLDIKPVFATGRSTHTEVLFASTISDITNACTLLDYKTCSATALLICALTTVYCLLRGSVCHTAGSVKSTSGRKSGLATLPRPRPPSSSHQASPPSCCPVLAERPGAAAADLAGCTCMHRCLSGFAEGAEGEACGLPGALPRVAIGDLTGSAGLKSTSQPLGAQTRMRMRPEARGAAIVTQPVRPETAMSRMGPS